VGLDPALLTHDAEVLQALRDDPLKVASATAHWYTESLRAQAIAMANADRLELPMLVLVAGDDRIVDCNGS